MIIILNLNTSNTLCVCVFISLTRSHFIRNTLNLHHILMPLQSQFNNNKYVYFSKMFHSFFSPSLSFDAVFILFFFIMFHNCRHYCLTLWHMLDATNQNQMPRDENSSTMHSTHTRRQRTVNNSNNYVLKRCK